jgi:hypothetical protein
MKLSELRHVLDEGQTVIDTHGDGYVAAYKEQGKKRIYISIETFERKRHNGFKALCEHLAPDEEMFRSEQCGWEIETALTEEQEMLSTQLIEACTGDEKQVTKNLNDLFTDNLIKRAERELFTAPAPIKWLFKKQIAFYQAYHKEVDNQIEKRGILVCDLPN